MMKSVVLLVGLLTFSGLVRAAEPAQDGTGQAPATPPKTAAPPAAKSQPAAGEPKLKAQPAKQEDLKTAVDRAINVFVPKERIDVDKPVDFPTNI